MTYAIVKGDISGIKTKQSVLSNHQQQKQTVQLPDFSKLMENVNNVSDHLIKNSMILVRPALVHHPTNVYNVKMDFTMINSLNNVNLVGKDVNSVKINNFVIFASQVSSNTILKPSTLNSDRSPHNVLNLAVQQVILTGSKSLKTLI